MSLLNEVPSHIALAFDGEDEWDVEAFASRWGGLHTEVFLRVLSEGQDDDKVLAIFAIGYLATPWAKQQIWPFVKSPTRKERWASAMALGDSHDPLALPYLEQILLDGLDPTEKMSLEDEGWYEVQRDNTARLLTSWNVPVATTLIQTLRQSFLAVEALRVAKPCTDYLFFYQDTLAYALGHYGALHSLDKVDLTKPQRNLAMIYLALGSIRAEERYKNFSTAMILNQNLQQEVINVLAQQFDLSESEQYNVIKNFGDDQHRRIGETPWSPEDDEDNTDDSLTP